MDKKTIEILEREFESREIRFRPGRGGQRWSYIEGAGVIRRLNEAFHNSWSVEVREHSTMGEELLVLARLTVFDSETGKSICHDAWGSKRIEKAMECGDLLNAATTNALKKAATRLGIGLHLYTNDNQ